MIKQRRIISLCSLSSSTGFWGHNFTNGNDHLLCIAHSLLLQTRCLFALYFLPIYMWLILSSCGSKLRGSLLGSKLGRVGFCQRGCAYTLLQFVQRPGVCNAFYGRPTVHCKEPLKSFNKSRTEFRFPSVALFPLLCRNWREAIFTVYEVYFLYSDL